MYLWEKYDETPPQYENIFNVVPSAAAYEMFNSAIGLGDLLEKPEGESIQADAPMESYTIVCKNRTWARKVQFSYEAVKDAQKFSNILRETAGTWGQSYPRTRDKWYAQFFNYGAYTAGHDGTFDNSITGVVTDSSGDFIYDSKPFFSTAHPDKVGNTYANYTETRALTHANLKTTYLTYTSTNNRDERGSVIELMPDTLLIPPALRFTAQEILQTTLIPDSMDNTINVLSTIVSPMTWAHLTDTDGWFLGAKGKGLLATTREDPEIDFYQDEGDTKDFYAVIMCRWGGCVNNFRFWYGCNIATA